MRQDEILQAMMDGRTSPGAIRGLVPADLEKLYALGHALYDRGCLDEAADVFALLTIYEPVDPRFWFARGAAEQERRRLPEAIAAYSFAALLDDEDPWAMVHLGECLLIHGQRTTGLDALARALARAGSSRHHSAARARAEAFLTYAEQGHAR